MKTIAIINGPNLNLLGEREPEIYGVETLAELTLRIEKRAKELGFAIWAFQSNSEGALIDAIQEVRLKCVGMIINPAAYTHTSIAMLDALKMCEFPIIEVHISDISKREAFRKHSYVSLVASEVIKGEGTDGYLRALKLLTSKL